MGIKAESPRELINQAKDIVFRHRELKSETASLGAQINALQAEQNEKVFKFLQIILITLHCVCSLESHVS